MRVLLAEDNKQLAGRLREDLLRRDFAVDLAGNGVDAEHLGNEEDYDCVNLDLGLPQGPGLEVLKNWRKRRKLMPVLILTARDAWLEKVEGFRAGADDYMAKPFHFEELLARLHALIRRSHGHALPILGGDGLSLDEDRQTVIRDGVPSALSGVEFRLLRYMMLHPSKLLSKTELGDHIFADDSDKDSNVIEVHVNHLRNKIGKHRISTRHGQGYVFGETD